MSKTLVVFGATGQQGRSVLTHVLKDPVLSAAYSTIRAVTRDPTSASAQSLLSLSSQYSVNNAAPDSTRSNDSNDIPTAKVELVKADYNDADSLVQALQGSHTIFAQTPAVFGPNALETEFQAGKLLVDTAVAQGVQYIIFSTLPDISVNSHGKYTGVSGFDAKARVERYIRSLPVPSAFVAVGSFMQNWHQRWDAARQDDGSYTISRHTSATQHKLPLIDIVEDTGKFVGAILADPDQYAGHTFCAATRLYSMQEIAAIMSRATGQVIRYQQIPVAEFRKTLPPWGGMLVDMMRYQEEFGYYGPDTESKVQWAAQHARGHVTEFEDYLRKNPLKLAGADKQEVQ